MDDAGPFLAADTAQVLYVMEQRVDQRAAGMPGGRMHDHASGLVDHDEVAVLIQDPERQRFWRRRRVGRLRCVDFDELAGLDRLIRLRRAPRDQDVTVLDEPLYSRSRLSWKHRDEKEVEADAVAVARNRERRERRDRRESRHAAFRACLGSGETVRRR